MKDTKWVDIRVGEYIFTVKCRRNFDDWFGMHIQATIFELHPHPTTFWQRFSESFKYHIYRTSEWYEGLCDISLIEFLNCECGLEALAQDRNKKTIDQWENL